MELKNDINLIKLAYSRIGSVLVNRPVKGYFLIANLMYDKDIALIWNWYFFHYINYVSFNWNWSVGQMNSVKLLQNLLKRVHECIMRQNTNGLLCVNIVYVLLHMISPQLIPQGRR